MLYAITKVPKGEPSSAVEIANYEVADIVRSLGRRWEQLQWTFGRLYCAAARWFGKASRVIALPRKEVS